MKIGFAARWSPLDKRSWSGTCCYTYRQIKRNNDVEIFHFKWPWYLREWLTTQKSLNRILFKKHTTVEFLTSYAKFFSRQLQKELKKKPVDVLFVSASPQLIAYLKTDIPIIFMIDTTFQQLLNYYPYYSNLAGYNIKRGIKLDKKAFQNATHCMLTSAWAKNSAVQDYGINADKISVALCGANLDHVPELKDIDCAAGASCRLLFLGVEWERKGGDIALQTFRLLQKKGINVQLHIIGCIPPVNISDYKNITVIPFLNKDKETDIRRLHNIFNETDFLLLPARAECAGIVFCEASAYGIPSITTDTGGVSDYVKDGVNGFVFSQVAGPETYADKIVSVLQNPDQLKELKLNCRKQYNELLNWDTWGRSFELIVDKLVRV
jgi:glycosyltransferase involved in cell wall biosynthesis